MTRNGQPRIGRINIGRFSKGACASCLLLGLVIVGSLPATINTVRAQEPDDKCTALGLVQQWRGTISGTVAAREESANNFGSHVQSISHHGDFRFVLDQNETTPGSTTFTFTGHSEGNATIND